jgi:hypothetical protein
MEDGVGVIVSPTPVFILLGSIQALPLAITLVTIVHVVAIRSIFTIVPIVIVVVSFIVIALRMAITVMVPIVIAIMIPIMIPILGQSQSWGHQQSAQQQRSENPTHNYLLRTKGN